MCLHACTPYMHWNAFSSVLLIGYPSLPIKLGRSYIQLLQSVDYGSQGDLTQRTTRKQNFGIIGPDEQIIYRIREGFSPSHLCNSQPLLQSSTARYRDHRIKGEKKLTQSLIVRYKGSSMESENKLK